MQARPFESAGIAAYPTRAAWDAAAVEVLGSVLRRWNLTAGEAYIGGYSGAVLAVTCEDGSPAVLKVGFPHEEAISEALGLAALGAGLAPKLLRQDPWAWAILLEKVDPGTRLQDAGLGTTEALRVGGELLASVAAVGMVADVPTLADVVHGYAAVARSRWDEHRDRIAAIGAVDLVTEAIVELDALADGGPATSLVHGDFNPGNLLSSERGWLTVDPKPMTGDPAFDLWPLVSQLGSPFDTGDPVAALSRQLTTAASAAGVDPVRSARWAFARSGLNVSWYVEESNLQLAAASARETRVWRALLQSLAH